MVDCKSQEGITVWFVRAVKPAAAIGSWGNVVEHGVYLAAGDVKMSLIQFVWLNETSGSLLPLALLEHSDLRPPPPHAWGPPSPVPPTRPRAGG